MVKVLFKTTLFLVFVSNAWAQQVSDSNLHLATKIYNRLNSSKLGLDHPVIQAMAKEIASGNMKRAAQIASEENNFLNITVRDFAVQMSTREEAVGTGLNDFTATVVGVVRDNLDARELLTGNFFYKASPAAMTTRQDMLGDILRSNNHYAEIERLRLSLKDVLIREPQKISRRNQTVEDHPDAAGVLTSRAFMEAHHLAGTGRRPVEFTFREFLCLPIDQVADNSGPDDRIGRDIPRFPGGDHNEFKTNCKSCHVPMDGFRGAFAYFTFDSNSVRYGNIDATTNGNSVNGFSRLPASDGSQNYISNKFNWNTDQYPQGYITSDDSWVNYANFGKNQKLIGWESSSGGKGLNSFARAIASTKAFPKCMAKRVFSSLCKRAPSSLETNFIENAAANFEDSNFNLKELFENVAVSKECIGE